MEYLQAEGWGDMALDKKHDNKAYGK